MIEIKYENLVRFAYGYNLGKMIEKAADPAGLANADIFRSGDLPRIKLGAGYAMEVFIQDLNNNVSDLGVSEAARISDFVSRLLSAPSKEEAGRIIEDFTDTVLAKYYETKEGVTSLK